jgi:lysophospholipase L1-like esterase
VTALDLLALGDSIIWGQGNVDGQKFVALVSAWLKSRGHEPALTLVAHSGAVAIPTQNDSAPAQWAEVPEDAPSISAQVRAASQLADPRTVDVVLFNGGINDVSPFHIVVANPFDPNAEAKLERKIRQVFGDFFPRLLDQVVTTFPNARIVVTGYYPIVSEQTGVRPLVNLLKQLPRPEDLASFLDRTAADLSDEVLALTIESERGRIVAQSRLFATQSDQLLKLAVQAYASSGRVFFASPGFGPANAFSAPDTWLWSGSDDPLYPERLRRYGDHVVQSPFDWPLVTPLASMCHPNVQGSAAYAEAIEACLEEAGL